MIRNYFITSLRKLWRNKSYTLINTIGLSLGISCALAIFLLVRHELSYDNWHTKRDRIFRVVTDSDVNGERNMSLSSPMPLSTEMKKDFPELEQSTLAMYFYGGLATVTPPTGEMRKFQEKTGMSFVEPAFFEIFDFEWKAGSGASLKDPYCVVLTESLAKKFFGNEDPINKIVRFENQFDFKVTGVLKDMPLNSDFPFAFMMSLSTIYVDKLILGGLDPLDWGNLTSNANTYLLLRNPADAPSLESKLVEWRKKFVKDNNNKNTERLQPISDMHYAPEYGTWSGKTTSRGALWTLGLIGVFLVVAGCINFINLATAQAVNRSKEIGVRKVLGANRLQLGIQFIGETLLLSLLSAMVAVVLLELFMPKLLSVVNIEMTFHLTEWRVVAFVAGLTVLVGVVSGFYPALVLSGFTPALALKGKSISSGGAGLRKGLVVVQFAISQVLIIGTIVATMQMDLFLTRDLGFVKDAVVTVPLPAQETTRFETFRNGLRSIPEVQQASFCFSGAASENRWDQDVKYRKGTEERAFVTDLKWADEYYLETHGIRLLAGRNLLASDTISEYVVNEAFARHMGFENPADAIGQTILLGRRGYKPIVGVVGNFHTTSLRDGIRPTVITTRSKFYYEASVKIQSKDIPAVMGSIEKVWSVAFPEFVFSHEFMDERIREFYKDEKKAGDLFRIFSSIAILISALGLFGFISFMAEQRTKEIGVRKVLGASVYQILWLLGRDFGLLIVIAFGVAAPIGYLVMNKWMEDYAYKVEIGPTILLLSILSSFLVAITTVGYRALRAATANPVDSLKCE